MLCSDILDLFGISEGKECKSNEKTKRISTDNKPAQEFWPWSKAWLGSEGKGELLKIERNANFLYFFSLQVKTEKLHLTEKLPTCAVKLQKPKWR